MAWVTAQYKLISTAPLLMHNGQIANPLNKWAKKMKQVTSKRVKTDADHEELARLEFLASLYMIESGPVIPAEMVDATLINAAKKSKEGMSAKSALFCAEHAPLEYDGPRTADDLWSNEDFRHSAIVRVGTARVVRTRPVFSSWSTVVKINIESSVINPSRIDEWFTIAGTLVGFGDWRPRHGRFDALRIG
jgi:hypothetical protein